jgi:hypothetical protein
VILLNFCNNTDQLDKNDEDFGRLWKIMTLFDNLDNSYAKFYNLSEHQAAEEIIMFYKGQIIFKQ